jgi:hypothetical protein
MVEKLATKAQELIGMCKSIEDSLFSGVLSYFTGAVLLLTGKPKYIWIGALIIAVGSMQFIDAMIWYKKSQGESSVDWARYGVPTVLTAQYLSGYLGYVYYYNKRMPIYEGVLIVSILGMFYLYTSHCDESTLDKEGYLIWCGKDNTGMNPSFRLLCRTLVMLLIFFPFFWFPDLFFRYGILGIAFVLWMTTLLYDSFGSRWCYSFFLGDLMILAKALLIGL